MDHSSTTIAAQATPPGQSGLGVLRISGPKAKNIALKVTGRTLRARCATYCEFKNAEGVTLDKGIAIFFAAPHSFTGEDVLELQGHGSPVVLDQLLHVVIKEGARLARPGEFSERAFLNQKLDLVQAESIADLINASSLQAARSAMRSLNGEFSKKISTLVDLLSELRKMVETAIDFSEEDIDFLTDNQIRKDLQGIITYIKKIKETAGQGALLQQGITLVIIGQPNVGKSTLLNCLCREDRAIVTPIAGTTRDVLRESIHIDGLPLHIVDTAGLRESEDVVEKEGIRRAYLEIEKADMLLLMLTEDNMDCINEKVIKKQLPIGILENTPLLIIKNKIDLSNEAPEKTSVGVYPCIKLSAKFNQGINLLESFIKQRVGYHDAQANTFIARRRHLEAICEAKTLLENGLAELTCHQAKELLAEDLRLAQQALSEITGEFYSDDLLGEIFSSFCIGK